MEGEMMITDAMLERAADAYIVVFNEQKPGARWRPARPPSRAIARTKLKQRLMRAMEAALEADGIYKIDCITLPRVGEPWALIGNNRRLPWDELTADERLDMVERLAGPGYIREVYEYIRLRTVDTSDIPEATEEFFRSAKLRDPK
jgi:hypothetical protein